jgi:hypothetical protein
MATYKSSSSPGKSRSTTWKNYSIDNCDQTVTDMMIGFMAFGSLHQGQPKVRHFLIANITWKNKVNDLE